MFRRWLSGFIRNNKEKIKLLLKVCLIIGLFVYGISFIFSHLKTNKKEEKTNLYNPSETVISGKNIEKEEFEKQDNTIKNFVNYCNDGEIQQAYDLLTNECKERLCPTIKDFKNKYYNPIFKDGSKEYNLQSWVNSGKYTTYRIRYTEDFMETGKYDGSVKYEDYITIVNEEDKPKLNINNYIKTENINKITKTDEIEFEVISKDVYMEYIIYNIKAKNMTNNEILLDDLKEHSYLVLVGADSTEYILDTTKITYNALRIGPYQTKDIQLQFIKQYGADRLEKNIKFKNTILDYLDYKENKNNYNNYKKINIDV